MNRKVKHIFSVGTGYRAENRFFPQMKTS